MTSGQSPDRRELWAAPLLGTAERRPASDPRPFNQSDCATLKAKLGDLPADLLGAEQVHSYIQTRRAKGAGGSGPASKGATRTFRRHTHTGARYSTRRAQLGGPARMVHSAPVC